MKLEARAQTDICTPMFIAAWVTSQEVEATQVSIDRWMDKQNILYIQEWNDIQLKKEGNSDTPVSIGEPWEHDAEWNKPDTEGQVLSDSTHRRALESNPQRQKVDGGGQGMGVDGELVFNED